MARTQQVKIKGNAHTTEYENNTPVERQGFNILPTKYGAILRRTYVFFWSRTSMYAPVKKAARYLYLLLFLLKSTTHVRVEHKKAAKFRRFSFMESVYCTTRTPY